MFNWVTRQIMVELERMTMQVVEALDFRLKFCKGNFRDWLVVLEERKWDIVIPRGPLTQNVSIDIKCDKGEHTGCKYDILDFNKVSYL
jgi:hypothetical protein